MQKNNAIQFVEKMQHDRALKKRILDLFTHNKGKEIELVTVELHLPCSYREFIKAFYKTEKKQDLTTAELEKIAAGGLSVFKISSPRR